MPEPREASPKRARSVGKRTVQIAYWAFAGWMCVASAAGVTLQVFAKPPDIPKFASCSEGLRQLAAGVVAARGAAATGEGDTDEALARFRGALGPAWSARDTVADLCRSPADEGALDAIERLRYAEEHAVRREAGELAPLRRRVQALVDARPAPAPDPGSRPVPAPESTQRSP